MLPAQWTGGTGEKVKHNRGSETHGEWVNELVKEWSFCWESWDPTPFLGVNIFPVLLQSRGTPSWTLCGKHPHRPDTCTHCVLHQYWRSDARGSSGLHLGWPCQLALLRPLLLQFWGTTAMLWKANMSFQIGTWLYITGDQESTIFALAVTGLYKQRLGLPFGSSWNLADSNESGVGVKLRCQTEWPGPPKARKSRSFSSTRSACV